MRPRLVTRMHYQIDEPAFLRTLVLWCTFATKSTQRDRVAKQLVDTLSDQGVVINIAASGYAIDLGKNLGLLNDNLVWTEKALVLKALGDADTQPSKELQLAEKLFFLSVLLESDGSAILYAARRLISDGRLPDKSKGETWVEFANSMFSDVLLEYLEFVTDVRSRTWLRQTLSRRGKKKFSGKSGAHQSFFHLQSMHRIGLVKRMNGRVYYLQNEHSSEHEALSNLSKLLPNLRSLEESIQEDRTLEIAATTLLNRKTEPFKGDETALFDVVKEVYSTR